MLEQIGTAIVMFLIGSACTYFYGKWSGIFTKVDALEYGLQSLLRDRIIQMHQYYKRTAKPIPQREIDSFEQMFLAYKRLGGNGYVDDIRKVVIEDLPHETH